MKERIYWIDWAKAWCISVVVFDHTPHDGSPFLLQYLAGTNLATFFFISGFLKANSSSPKPTRQYCYTLLLPYLIYNAIYYPFWLGKLYIRQQGDIALTDCLKPIAGTFLGQLNTSMSCELNGVTWFLLSLFLMHCLCGLCRSLRHTYAAMLVLALTAMVLYGLNKYSPYAQNLTYNGFVRSLCFFFLGYIVRSENWLKALPTSSSLPLGLTALAGSLALFYWHIHTPAFPQHIVLYYASSFLAIPGSIFICRSLQSLHPWAVTTVATGTMLIFGTHRMVMGVIDFAMERLLAIGDIVYTIPQAVGLTIVILLLLLPPIAWLSHHAPLLLGRRKAKAGT